jgi:hypothetical protein
MPERAVPLARLLRVATLKTAVPQPLVVLLLRAPQLMHRHWGAAKRGGGVRTGPPMVKAGIGAISSSPAALRVCTHIGPSFLTFGRIACTRKEGRAVSWRPRLSNKRMHHHCTVISSAGLRTLRRLSRSLQTWFAHWL